MTSSAWESYWKDHSNQDWWKNPAPEVLDLIRSLSPIDQPKVLDLGCGLGRHAIAFALAQFSVTAIDASAEAIQHLRDWSRGLQLSIETQICDAREMKVPNETFDVVLSYNVIYHGSREQFARAIRQVRRLLKRKGIFFFTCPTRDDGKYGFGKRVAPHTYRCEKSITPGDIHYFADEKDLAELLTGFKIQARWKSEGYWDNQGEKQFFSNWHVRAEKF
ncbi:putative Type 11 methyltransferase [Candidatus Zixiibacteriota bacterium]|nr:putative Type 11 methyltransferase [candidate division Zixibacteria bacterium]